MTTDPICNRTMDLVMALGSSFVWDTTIASAAAWSLNPNMVSGN